MPIFTVGCAALSDSAVWEFLETTANVRARDRSRIGVDVEQAKVDVMAIVTANVEAGVQRTKVPGIARVGLGAAICGSGDKERIPAARLDGKSGRMAVGQSADRRAADAVAEFRGVQDDVETIVVVVAAVAPVQHVIPQALDVAVLCPAAVGGAAAQGRAGVVGHRVGVAHRLLGATVAAAVADDFLTVPVAKFDDVQQPDGKPHRKIALPDGEAKFVDVGAGRAAGNARLGETAGAALVSAAAVVAANVHHIPLAVAVLSVHVGRADAVALHRAVGDLDGHAPAVLGKLIPKFRDGNHRAAGALAFYHARPGLQIVKGTAVAAYPRHVRHRVGKLRRLVGAAPSGGAGAVPARAVDVDIGKLKGVIPVLAHLHAALGGPVAQRGRHDPSACDGQIQLDAPALRHGAGDGLVPALGGDGAARLDRHGQGVVGQRQGLGATVFRLHRLRDRADAERGRDRPLPVMGQRRRKASALRHAAHALLTVREDDGAARLDLYHHPGQYDAAHRRSIGGCVGNGEGLVGLDFDSVDAVAHGFCICRRISYGQCFVGACAGSC